MSTPSADPPENAVGTEIGASGSKRDRALSVERDALTRAVADWVERTDLTPIRRWLERALDPDGVPKQQPVETWWPVLATLAQARRRRPNEWPKELDERFEGLVRAALRFSRPDGSSVFEADRPGPERGELLKYWARRLADPGLATVVRWWSDPGPSARRGLAPPPLPAFACANRPLAVLRADWLAKSDFLAIDGRDPGRPDRLELIGQGARLLGPDWSPGPEARPARALRWTTGPHADLAEWTFRTPAGRVTRSALLLRGRGLALLADQVQTADPEATMRVALAPGVEVGPDAESRALALSVNRVGARLIPLALPSLGSSVERGTFGVEGREIVLRQPARGGRCWLPMLVSWRPERNRKTVRWRTLTVTERSKVCPADVAVAFRAGWGLDDGLVIYRSLGRPGLRAFLGHQTSARFLVGLFDRSGEVEPLVRVEG